MNKPRIIVVDDNDQEIGLKSRYEADEENLRYRVSALWIFNSKGECLLAKRALTKRHDPGKWSPAVAGTLDEGETYEDNIIKEAEEELGIKGIKFKKGIKEKVDERYRYFLQWFTCVVDKPAEEFIIQEEEVDGVKWFSEDEFRSLLKSNPDNFVAPMPKCLDLFYKS
ncbi:MAG: NUDIX domain-containing protein [archaeon]